MKQLFNLLLCAAIAMTLVISTGCKGGCSSDRDDAVRTNFSFDSMPNPDEAFDALKVALGGLDKGQWEKNLDKKSEIAKGSDYEVCFTMGVRSANALLAMFLGDEATAKAIGTGLKSGAEALTIKSGEVETAASELSKSFDEKDEKQKENKIKNALNGLRDALVNTLKDTNRPDVALFINFGTWVEMLRQTSTVIAINYSVERAAVLNSKAEADFFKKEFTSLKIKKGDDPMVKACLEASSQLGEIMVQGKSAITKEQVQKIQGISAKLYQDYTK